MHPADARELAMTLMREHGLTGWRFAFDRARRRFGSCRPTQKVITLSHPITTLNSPEQVRDTVLHEIAHALTPGDGHGRRWRAMCVKLGAKPERCYTDATVNSPPRPPSRYRIGCPACEWWADRRRAVTRKLICRQCRGAIKVLERMGV